MFLFANRKIFSRRMSLFLLITSLFLTLSCISAQEIPSAAASKQLPTIKLLDTVTPTIGRYKTLELAFTTASTPTNPFDTYLLKLELTDPDGTKFTIDGFYDGDGNGGQTGNIWTVRIAPYKAGTWSWRTVPGDGGVIDSGLENLSGQFNVVENGDVGGIINDGQHFKFQNGDYIYLVGNFLDFTNGLRTTHTFMSETTSDAERDAIIAHHRDFHMVNKANIYFANKGDYWGQSVTPWVGTANNNDKTKMDLARWKLYDQYILRFKNNGILAEMWFFADDSNFGNLSQADRERLFRYAMARTSAFSHTLYVIALEWQEGFNAQQITDSGNYIQSHNPWGRMVSVHSLTLTNWDFAGDSWPTFIASQSGNDAQPSTVNDYAITMGNSDTIPHIGEEFGFLDDSSDTTRLRANLWANFCGGAAGGGTGSDLKALQRFLAQSRVPFQRMSPANNLVQDGGTTRFVLAETNHHYVVYSSGGSFTLNVSGSNLTGYWYNPRNPGASLGTPFAVSAGNQTFTPPNNVNKDWVLWISDGTNLNSGVINMPPEVSVLLPLIGVDS